QLGEATRHLLIELEDLRGVPAHAAARDVRLRSALRRAIERLQARPHRAGGLPRHRPRRSLENARSHALHLARRLGRRQRPNTLRRTRKSLRLTDPDAGPARQSRQPPKVPSTDEDSGPMTTIYFRLRAASASANPGTISAPNTACTLDPAIAST